MTSITMTPQEMIDKISESDTIGFQIAREYFNWNNLTIVEWHYKASQVVHLANLIDDGIGDKYSEALEILEEVLDNCESTDGSSATLFHVAWKLEEFKESK